MDHSCQSVKWSKSGEKRKVDMCAHQRISNQAPIYLCKGSAKHRQVFGSLGVVTQPLLIIHEPSDHIDEVAWSYFSFEVGHQKGLSATASICCLVLFVFEISGQIFTAIQDKGPFFETQKVKR